MGTLGEGIDPETAFGYLRALAGLGVRVAGTPAEEAGAELVARALEAQDLAVHRQRFPVRLWVEQRVTLHAVAPTAFPVPAVSVCFGGTLPPGEHEFDLGFVGQGSPFDLARGDLEGRAWRLGRDVYKDYPDTALVRRIAGHRPAALLFTASPDHRGGMVFPTCSIISATAARRHPASWSALTMRCDAMRCDAMRLVASGTSRARLTLEAEVRPASSVDIVGVLPGTRRPEEIVVVCAHHDSAPSSPGACDNAGGTACVIELARLAAAHGPFARTLHFAIWGAHETGMHGSEAYLRQALGDGAQALAALNFDTVGLRIAEDRPYVLGGLAWERQVTEIVEATGIEPVVVPGPGYTDYTNFGAAGIPSLSFGQGFANWNHTPGDSIDHCSPRGLLKPLVIAAAVLGPLAEDGIVDARGEFPAERVAMVRAFNARWGWSSFDAAA